MKFLIPFLIAYLGSKLIFSYFNFNYAVFSDPFDLIKLLIDISVFIALFVFGERLFKAFSNNRYS